MQRIEEWAEYEGLNTQVGVRCASFELPADRYNRKTMRSMGRVAQLATRASELALEQAGLLGDPLVTGGQMGVSYGSSSGTPSAIGDFGRMMSVKSIEGINANTYVKMMSHTATVNIAVFFGITGRIITTSSACTVRFNCGQKFGASSPAVMTTASATASSGVPSGIRQS